MGSWSVPPWRDCQQVPSPPGWATTDDGRMWTALPDQMSSHAPHQTTTGRKNNAWITPLLSLRDGEERPVIDPTTAQNRRLPIDLGAPGHQRTLAAPRSLGRPEVDDPPEPERPSCTAAILTPTVALYLGSCCSRLRDGMPVWSSIGPGDAPAVSTLEKRSWSVQYYYFGTDPGQCHGFYLSQLTRSPPDAIGCLP